MNIPYLVLTTQTILSCRFTFRPPISFGSFCLYHRTTNASGGSDALPKYVRSDTTPEIRITGLKWISPLKSYGGVMKSLFRLFFKLSFWPVDINNVIQPSWKLTFYWTAFLNSGVLCYHPWPIKQFAIMISHGDRNIYNLWTFWILQHTKSNLALTHCFLTDFPS